MSLTSYRAAPPRGNVKRGTLPARDPLCSSGRWHLEGRLQKVFAGARLRAVKGGRDRGKLRPDRLAAPGREALLFPYYRLLSYGFSRWNSSQIGPLPKGQDQDSRPRP